MSNQTPREGSLEAPKRHPLDWRGRDFYDEQALFAELERVFDICHGCRRCFNLCHAFPTLFDLIDESESMELDGVAKTDYWKVVEHCYLCDMCFMTKCPYVPPHEWNVDFPHLMLRAKAFANRKGKVRTRDRILSSTDAVGALASIPVAAPVVNAAIRMPAARVLLEKSLGVDRKARVPEYHSDTLRKRMRGHRSATTDVKATEATRGKVVLFGTCYGNYNEPALGEDLVAVFEHNAIFVVLCDDARCCGMPKLELGDLEAVDRVRQHNVPRLANFVDQGFDIVAPIPSCVLMFKQELPLMFPDDAGVAKVRDAIFDPFEYLILRHRAGELRTDFAAPLGHVAYHVACHQRVQNIGLKTKEVLELVPDTRVTAIERCSAHDGTYAVKKKFHDIAMKLVRPVAKRVSDAKPDHYTSDCVLAASHIEHGLGDGSKAEPPFKLLRRAYGI
ncbi:MAG: Fe-S oxidoreductase [Gammaproteobacteria bacterium]|nr:Fe-S oxidoreductase [Gammaproteobacteria bacterium]NIM71831.1 Fe-S oxidoreductase [Gammaproteobacteria bacterium]NIN37953.1 Fe-S oxidoreductase [Gammaproteobacteria bacterium]NIO23587.1 Fe-S oxidoreductase [Gammaproteobacteria bacterium]NIO64203.1 Fe-S oxidoreductase [Gammaproteobacteria bacterium]